MTESYNTQNIEHIIHDLTQRFDEGCEQYRQTLVQRKSNRSRKELSKRNLRGSRIHDYESDFAWLLHEIRMGPVCLIDENVDRAKKLINTIKDIS